MFLQVAVFAQEETKPQWIELNGYVKNLQNVSFVNRIDQLSSLNLIHNRLNIKCNISAKLSARLEIRNRLFYGDQIKLYPNFGETINQYNGLINLSKLWVNEPTMVVHSVIDRMLLQYATNNWDIKIGRQRINWGINNTWNPNDIFNAYNFLDFDYEERPGNDALRIQHYLKNNSTLELAYKPSKNTTEHIAAALYKFNKKNYDWQVLTGIYKTDVVIGGGWAGNLKNTGFKGEISYFHPQKNITDTTGTISLSVMADQTFKNDWYVSVATLFNSRPSNSLGAANIISSNLSAKALFPYRYTFYTGVMKSFSPITAANFSVIYSPEKNTLILFPTFSWNVAKNFDVDFTAQSFFAKGINNKYGTQGNAFFMRGKWNF